MEARIIHNPNSPSPTIIQFSYKVLPKGNPNSNKLKKAVQNWISFNTDFKIIKGDLAINIAIFRSDVKNLEKVDVDNLAKACLDALKKIVFDDDRQVKLLIISKHYSKKCKLLASIEYFDELKFQNLVQNYNYNLAPLLIHTKGIEKYVEV